MSFTFHREIAEDEILPFPFWAHSYLRASCLLNDIKRRKCRIIPGYGCGFGLSLIVLQQTFIGSNMASVCASGLLCSKNSNRWGPAGRLCVQQWGSVKEAGAQWWKPFWLHPWASRSVSTFSGFSCSFVFFKLYCKDGAACGIQPATSSTCEWEHHSHPQASTEHLHPPVPR